MCRNPSLSITPYPVHLEPGSMPIMRVFSITFSVMAEADREDLLLFLFMGVYHCGGLRVKDFEYFLILLSARSGNLLRDSFVCLQ